MKKYLINFLNYVYKNKFPDLEIDARIVIYSFLMKELNIINYSYTYYRDNSPGITLNIKIFIKLVEEKISSFYVYVSFNEKV